jgi:dTMP kinase
MPAAMGRQPGCFIAFEGIDGAGKSTQVAMLRDRLERAERTTWVTSEPTHGVIGQLIREVLSGSVAMTEEALTVLYAADRLEHVTGSVGILDWLQKVDAVICDRYILSTYAYHSQHLDLDWIMNVNELARSLAEPSLTIYLDVRPEVAITRLIDRAGKAERYETIEKLRVISAAYANILADASDVGWDIVILDGAQNQSQIADVVWRAIQQREIL